MTPGLDENDVGRMLRQGEVTVEEAVELFTSDSVLVYADIPEPEGWDLIGQAGARSTVFADLANAGASNEERNMVAEAILRAREQGRTIDSFYGWPAPEPFEPDPTAPSGDHLSS